MNRVGFVANEVQSAESLRGLILLFSLIPAGLGLLSIAISLFYPLHDKRVAEIEEKLVVRKEGDSQRQQWDQTGGRG